MSWAFRAFGHIPLALLPFSWPTNSPAATFYVTPEKNLSADRDCTTPAKSCKPSAVWSHVSPGDEVIYLDGVYTGADYMIKPPDSLDGTANNPILVRAETDGGVRINGEHERVPIFIRSDWFVVEGFNAHAGHPSPIYMGGGTYDNTLRRIVAWDATDANTYLFRNGSHRLLGEDLAGFGVARKIFGGGNQMTCRRCWGRWEGCTSGGPKMAMTLWYNKLDRLCENCIMSWATGSMPERYALHLDDGTMIAGKENLDGCTEIDQPRGAFGSDKTLDIPDRAIGARLYGSFAYISPDTECFSPYYRGAIQLSAPSETSPNRQNDVQIVNVASYVPSGPAFSNNTAAVLGPGWYIEPHNLFLIDFTGIAPLPNGVHEDWEQTDVEHVLRVSDLEPPLDSVYEGNGAHICYRYEDGVETATPFFPWPMQERILEATTFASRSDHQHKMRTNCNSGMCTDEWVTDPHAIADVEGEIERIFGPIPAQCRSSSSDSMPPSPPSGLSVF